MDTTISPRLSLNSHSQDTCENVKDVTPCNCKLIIFEKEIKLILAEMNIITKWIERKFGTLLIDKNSELFKQHLYKCEEIDLLTEPLTLKTYANIPNFSQRKKQPDIKSKQKRGKRNINASKPNCLNKNDGLGTTPSASIQSNNKAINYFKLHTAIYQESIQAKVNNKNVENLNAKNGKEDPKNYENSISDNRQNTNVSDSLVCAVKEENANGGIEESMEIHIKNGPANTSNIKKKCEFKLINKKITKRIISDAVRDTDNVIDSHDEGESPRSRGKNSDWRQYACSGPKQCDECGKVVMGTSSLKQHKRMHADERPFGCPECGKTFRYRKNLKIHKIALHNGERHLQCSFCGKKFYAPKDLKIHERTHTGHKPFACQLCPKKFNIKGHLTMHIRVHTGERPYRCPICDKSFSQANSLRVHKKIHVKYADADTNNIAKKKRKSKKPKFPDQEVNALKTENSNANNDLPSIPASTHSASVSTFQLMVPTMQTVTAAIVSVSTVTSPFPCVNLTNNQSGTENGLLQTNYMPIIGSSSEQPLNQPCIIPQTAVFTGESSSATSNTSADPDQIAGQINQSIPNANLENVLETPFETGNHDTNDANVVCKN